MSIHIVGVDCATQPGNVGLVRVSVNDKACTLLETPKISASNLPEMIIAAWHKETPISLIALDAPLGWPASLGAALIKHQAGAHIPVSMDDLFHRNTDCTDRLGKKPLEVGANLIARTAWAALDLLDKVRRLTGEPIPLAWEGRLPPQLSAIEVYPAATWRALAASHQLGKTRKDSEGHIKDVLADLLGGCRQQLENIKSPHTLDAILCAIAAHDFIEGRCDAPPDRALAEKEGWIWVRSRS